MADILTLNIYAKRGRDLEITNEGACKGYPTNWWFPEDNTRASKDNMAKAITICSACNISKECLQYALENETHGIWGGMKEVERELLRRRLGVQLSPRALTSQSTTVRRVSRRLTKDKSHV